MEIRVLRYFLTVVREENITKAAEVLHITQPTLSRQIAQMEEEMGVRLFDRGTRKITRECCCAAGRRRFWNWWIKRKKSLPNRMRQSQERYPSDAGILPRCGVCLICSALSRRDIRPLPLGFTPPLPTT